ncbi:glycosyltransferase [Candidatus Latescibacterota bacterium]
MDAIIVSGTWPTNNSGYGIAVTAALQVYTQYFNKVFFFGPSKMHFGNKNSWSNTNIDWIPLSLTLEPMWYRFLKSIAMSSPAITIRFKAGAHKFYKDISRVISNVHNSNHDIVIIYEDTPPSYYLPYIRHNFPNIQQAVHSHNVIYKGFSELKNQGPLLKRVAWLIELKKIYNFEKNIHNLADSYWVISDNDSLEYKKYYGNTPDGVFGVSIDTDRYKSVLPGDIYTMVHVGSANLRKAIGIRNFITTTWPLIRAKIPNAQLVLGGNNTKQFSDENLGIKGFGFVENELDILSKGLLYINPQNIGSGIKLKSIIAMLSGKVLVSTSTGIEGIEGIEGEHYFVAQDNRAMADQIVKLMRNASKTKKIGENAQMLAFRLYSRKYLFKKVKPLLDSFISQSSKISNFSPKKN